MAHVKTGSRAERARQTRRRMIDTAQKLFVSQGYPATTMDQIAAGAGVAVQTVYYSFKTKGNLLSEVVEVTAAGEDEVVPTMQRAWAQDMLAATSAQRILALGTEHGTGIYERVAQLWPAVSAAAAADAAVADYWRSVTTGRRAGQGAMVRRIAQLGALRPELDPHRATDLVYLFAGHDPYRALVMDAGWPVSVFKAWLFCTLVQQLLPSQDWDPDATSGLSFGTFPLR